MFHFFGVGVDGQKKIYISLSNIYGIGLHNSKDICRYLNIHHNCSLNDLSEGQISSLYHYIEQNYIVQSDLRKRESSHINRLMSIKSYRGFRHLFNLPVHGQRTHSNAKTQRRISSHRISSLK